ncbi:MAG: GAF domain-containing sensor histidine kinase [Myxococcaceae bacterium]
MPSIPGEDSSSGSDSQVTQRAFLTSARLKLSRLRLDGDLSRLFHQLCEISGHALDVARVGVWFFDDEKQALRCDALWSVKGEGVPLPVPMAQVPHYVSAVREQRFVATSDARTDPLTAELGEYLQAWDITSLLDASVYRNGQIVGLVCHEHVGPAREWKRDERQFAATVADLVSHFVEVNDRLAAQEHAHELELKLKDAHRLDALGRMAAGIAHDLNNLLGVITNGVQVLQRVNDPETLHAMEQSARHASTLVSQLMMLGRKSTPMAMVLGLDPLLTQLETVAGASAPASVKLVLDVEKGLEVWAESAQLQQVLLNLLQNAFQAMQTGVVVLRAHARQGGVSFEVIDTGEGIAPDHLEKLFDPFFTTRPGGHGIGLAVVQQLVTQHGGEIKVSSTVGDGTTFRIWWPSAAPK